MINGSMIMVLEDMVSGNVGWFENFSNEYKSINNLH